MNAAAKQERPNVNARPTQPCNALAGHPPDGGARKHVSPSRPHVLLASRSRGRLSHNLGVRWHGLTHDVQEEVRPRSAEEFEALYQVG